MTTLELENTSPMNLLWVRVHELREGEWRPTGDDSLLMPGDSVVIDLEAGRRRAELQEFNV